MRIADSRALFKGFEDFEASSSAIFSEATKALYKLGSDELHNSFLYRVWQIKSCQQEGPQKAVCPQT